MTIRQTARLLEFTAEAFAKQDAAFYAAMRRGERHDKRALEVVAQLGDYLESRNCNCDPARVDVARIAMRRV